MKIKTIEEAVKGELLKQIQSYIDEYDIEKDVGEILNNKNIQRLINDEIQVMISEEVHERIYTKVKESVNLIDAGIANNVYGFMIEFKEFMKWRASKQEVK